MWNLANGKQTAAFAGHTGGAPDGAYSGDGASIIAIDRRGALHFWDISTGRLLIQPLPAHVGASWPIVMFPDGQRFVTSGDDGLVKVWNTLSVGDACKISVEAFDDARRKEYLGDNSGTTGCTNLNGKV